MDDVHTGNKDGAKSGKRYAAQDGRRNAGEHSAQLRAKAAQTNYCAGNGGYIAAGNAGKAAQTDIGAAADDGNHVEHRGNNATNALSQYTAFGLAAGGQSVLGQHRSCGLVAHQLNQSNEGQDRDRNDGAELKLDAKVQRLGNTQPGFCGNGGKIQLAESCCYGAHHQDSDKRGSLGEKVAATEIIEQNHNDNGSGGQHQVDGIAVISGTYATGAVTDAHAAEAESQCHNNSTGDIGFEQDGKLFVEASPQHGGDNTANKAGAGEGSQTILGTQRDARGNEYKAALQGNGQACTDGAGAEGLQQGSDTCDQQASGNQNGDFAGGKTNSSTDEQRDRQDVKYENDDLLNTQWDCFFDGRAVIQPVAYRDFRHCGTTPSVHSD